jgi:IS30 family transposase
MSQRYRRGFTTAEKTELWDRWQRGESLKAIGRAFGKPSSSIYFQLAPHGGIRPAPRRRSRLALTLSEREEISRGIAAYQSTRSMARLLGHSPSTVSREISRNGGYDRYRAALADEKAWVRARRPKRCKLANNPRLRQAVARKLRLNWSPEQIAGWLKRTHPEDEFYHVSHETIYRSLFVQARGVLKKELLRHLRSKRTIRRSKRTGMHSDRRGQITDLVSISERPAAVEDRAVPGHWEGDLLSGLKNSYIATLVERHTRYVMLARVANKDTQTVVSALIKQAKTLPNELYKSLTWDRGKELADHRRFTLATNIDVYFCDPQSPTPVFRSRADAELTAKIYARVPVLVDETKGNDGNQWGVSFMRMFDMANDSSLFRTAAQLREAGFVRDGNDWTAPQGLAPNQGALMLSGGTDHQTLALNSSLPGRNHKRYVPLYEAKMVHQFDHRFGYYPDGHVDDTRALPRPSFIDKSNPKYEVMPRYWIPLIEVEERLAAKNWKNKWLMGWRDITNSTNEHTIICGVSRIVGVWR